ncbi:MAG: sulfotransferase [Hyphomonadaceae bacterium]|nr:sulfotransferase [Hyphomonadaceae bacterium]
MLVDSQAIFDAFDPQRLLKEAQEQAGLSDFGDQGFVSALEKLREYCSLDSRLDAMGLASNRTRIIRHLVNRLRFEDDLKRHPEILDEEVSDPIVILGMPRSGTTKTHRMMGVDPNLLKTITWQLVNPAPFPNAKPGEPDPRIEAAYSQEVLLSANDSNPALRAGHFYGAHEVQEDLWLFLLTFNYPTNSRPFSLGYHNYLMARRAPSDLENYAYFKKLIQYLQWQQGGRNGRRWLFKNIGNMAFMDELLQTFPNASLVHVHRKLTSSLPSIIKLTTELIRTENAEINSKDLIAYHVMRAKMVIDRYMESRDRLGLDGRILDIPYQRIRTDSLSVIREIYQHAEHTLAPESEQLMKDYELTNEQGKHGAHEYSLEGYGLSESAINNSFREYNRRYIL